MKTQSNIALNSPKFYLKKHKNNKYYVVMSYYNPYNKTNYVKYKSLKTNNKQIALLNFNKFIMNMNNDNDTSDIRINKNITLQEFFNEILNNLETNLKKGTVKIYRIAVNNLIRIAGNKQLRLYNIKNAEDYKTRRIQEVSKDTTNIDITTLKALFNIAIKLNYITKNVFKEVKKLKVNNDKIKIFTDNEINLILNNIHNITLLNIVKFGLYSGLRIKEILNLQLKDIDFINDTILIKDSKTGTKTIILNNKLKDLIDTILKKDNDTNIYNIALNSPDKYLFTLQNRNHPITSNYISHKFKKELRKLNLSEDLHFHSLRHTYISRLINAGAPLNFVKEIVGHSNIQTTLKYITLNKTELIKYANSI